MEENTAFDSFPKRTLFRTNSYKGKEIGGYSVICRGMLVVPRSWCNSCWSWILILAPSIVQLTVINPAFPNCEVILDIAYSISLFCTLMSLCLTTFTDPGIIPREDPEEHRRQLRNIFLAVDEDAEVDHVTVVKGKEILCQKCRTCSIYRPPRSFHCSDCQACIEVHDHHCPWVGNCVGKRNHRYFLSFAVFTTIHSTLTASIDLVFILEQLYTATKNGDYSTNHIIGIVMMVYCCIIICCLSGLSCYHGKLACCGMTTNEDLRGRYD